MRLVAIAAILALLAAPPVLGQPSDEEDPLTFLGGFLEAVELPKHALVIGNQNYLELPAVSNALNDAQTVATALRSVGFNVDTAHDLRRDAFFARLDDFVGRALALSAPDAAVVAFYFAGHGFRGGSENFLVPVDAATDDANLPRHSIPLSHIAERIADRRVALALFFLDACRTEFLGVGVDVDVGFVEPHGGVAASVYYAFASGFGQPSLSFVSSGDANSPFARSLAARLGNSSDKELHDLFEEVRREVATLTNRSQVPAEHKGDSFLGDHYFQPGPDRVRALKAELALALLEATVQDSACFVRDYVDLYPTSPYSTSARAWLLRNGGPAAETGPGCV